MNTYLLIFVILLLLVPVVLLVLYNTDNKYKEYKMLFIGISITIITICVIIFAASFYKTYHDDRTNFCKLKYNGIDYEFVKEKIFKIDSDGNRHEIKNNNEIINLDKEYLRSMTDTINLPIISDINKDRTQFINKHNLYNWYENLKSSYGVSTKPLSDDEYKTVPDNDDQNNDYQNIDEYFDNR